MSIVVKGAKSVTLAVVSDVRFFLVLAAGITVGGFLASFYFHEWKRGRKHFPIIGKNPDHVPPSVPIKSTNPPTSTPGRPPPGRPTGKRPPSGGGTGGGGVPARRKWGT